MTEMVEVITFSMFCINTSQQINCITLALDIVFEECTQTGVTSFFQFRFLRNI